MAAMTPHQKFITWIIALTTPSMGLVLATWVGVRGIERVKHAKPQVLKVSGSATRRIISDLIEWKATISADNPTRVDAYKTLAQQYEQAKAFLLERGITEDEIRPSSVSMEERFRTEYEVIGNQRIQRQVSLGWRAYQEILVRSNEIARVEKVASNITKLLERGIAVESTRPRYHYTKLAEVKVDMLAEAASNARERAARMVKAAGGAGLSQLRGARAGVVNVNPANSTVTSWEGNNDKTSYEKDIITIAHVEYTLPQ